MHRKPTNKPTNQPLKKIKNKIVGDFLSWDLNTRVSFSSIEGWMGLDLDRRKEERGRRYNLIWFYWLQKRREGGTKERRQTSQQQKHVKRFKVDQEEHEKGLKLNKCYPGWWVSEWVGGMEVVDMDSLKLSQSHKCFV